MTVEIFNIQRQRVFRQRFAGRQPRLSVETGLIPGIYLVQVHKGQGLLSQKLPVL
ncbi:hypothetical protein ACFP2F_21205 [Hymenobacter artigasi]|uniref:T9SS type A sorting domain-containing protein n=1 Tax=Hymenobacter artigasi TaxID=2719616 RepID=A0ABX1HKX6_9BACT|nr:hypothetical protein [Hymenobacter artigasi]NKI89601.1 hypothetical protein [Hymenobacter artigasi]